MPLNPQSYCAFIASAYVIFQNVILVSEYFLYEYLSIGKVVRFKIRDSNNGIKNKRVALWTSNGLMASSWPIIHGQIVWINPLIKSFIAGKCLALLFSHFPILQLVQRINSIYSAKRGKKRLKKLSMSNIETASLRGTTHASWFSDPFEY